MKYDKITPPEKSSEFMTLELGENRIRIVSEPEERGSHFDNATKKSTMCLGKSLCPFCLAGNKPTVRFLYRVIDRRDGLLKLLEVGYMVMGKILTYRADPDYAFEDIPDFDMKIIKTGADLATKYDVICSPRRSELNINEQDLVRAAEPLLDVIEKMREATRQELGLTGGVLKPAESVGVSEAEKIRIEDIPF